MAWQKFYWRWISLPFVAAWKVQSHTAAALRFLLPLVFVPLGRWYFPTWGEQMTSLAWQIPLVVLSGGYLVGFFLAPYWMDQEREKVEISLRAQLAEQSIQERKERENLCRLARLLLDEIARNLLLEGRQKAHLAWGAFDAFFNAFWQMIPDGTESTRELIKCLEDIDRAMRQVDISSPSTTTVGMFDSAYVPAAQATTAALHRFISQQETEVVLLR